MFFTTSMEMSDDERNYIDELFGNDAQSAITNIESENYEEIGDINKLIKALFTCNKISDAWDNIRANKEIIDFLDIFKCPFMQLDRTAVDIFKYMHDNNIIDDMNYMYFEVLSGKLNDWDFWKKKFENKDTVDILDMLNQSFNLAPNSNIYQIGLIDLTDEQEEYIFDRLKDGQLLDFAMTDRPSINIKPEIIVNLIINNHFNDKNVGLYFKVVMETYYALYDASPNKSEIIKNLFEIVWQYSILHKGENSAEDKFYKIISDMQLDELDKLKTFIEWYYLVDEKDGKYYNADESDEIMSLYTLINDKDFILRIIVNNPLFMIYSFTILDLLEKISGTKYTEFNLSKYLDEKNNLGMVISYSLHPMINTDNYIIKYPFPQYPMVYSMITGNLLLGNKIYNYSENKDILGFIDNYIISDTMDEEIFKNFNSEEEYKEFILAADMFRNQINKSIN